MLRTLLSCWWGPTQLRARYVAARKFGRCGKPPSVAPRVLLTAPRQPKLGAPAATNNAAITELLQEREPWASRLPRPTSSRTARATPPRERSRPMAALCGETRTRASELFDLAMQTVRANGLPGYRRHHTGHAIGLEIYEPPSSPPVVGRADWWSENLRWYGGQLHSVFDSDSITAMPEPILVGVAAYMYAAT